MEPFMNPPYPAAPWDPPPPPPPPLYPDDNQPNWAGPPFPADPHFHYHHHGNHRAPCGDYYPGDGYFPVADEQFPHFNGPTEDSFVGGPEFGNGGGQFRNQHGWKRKPDYHDAGSYVKLFVGGISRTSTEEDIRLLFEEHGHVVEVVFVRDKRTGQQQEYCFVKYASVEDADKAITALHNQITFPGGTAPIRVKFADGEKERLGTLEPKVYVNNLNKQASKQEIEEIFSSYGAVVDVYIMRDEFKQSRGCGFVGFSHRYMAVAAINGLSGSYVMNGCDRPLVVRFADPKKPKNVESRTTPNFADVRGIFIPDTSHPTLSSIGNPQMASETCADATPPQSTSDVVVVSDWVEDTLDCDWSEHISPDGYKYYYNCVTCESRWEKPEEFAAYEQIIRCRLRNSATQQPQPLACAEASSGKEGSSKHIEEHEGQFSQLEKPETPMSCAAEHNHEQVQVETSSLVAPPLVHQ